MNSLQVTELTLDSREVADLLPKRHADLLRDIAVYNSYFGQNAKLRSDDFWIESQYKSGTGKAYKCYQITKKGCEFLAHKMTGKKGAIFTATYINRFHEMEKTIQQGYIEAANLGCKTYLEQPVMTVNDFAILSNRNRAAVLWRLKDKELPYIKLMREDLDAYKRENNIPMHYSISSLVIFKEDTAYRLAQLMFNDLQNINIAIANYFGKQPVAVKKEKPKLLPLSEYSDIKAQADIVNEKLITIKNMLDRAFNRKNTPSTLYSYNSVLLDLGWNLQSDIVGLCEKLGNLVDTFAVD